MDESAIGNRKKSKPKSGLLKKAWFAGILFFCFVIVSMYYIMNKPHRDIANEKPDFEMSALALSEAFAHNEKSANIKFGNKVIQVSGKIIELSNQNNDISLFLEDKRKGVHCAIESNTANSDLKTIKPLHIGQNVIIKGKCDGFDMIMGVVLTQCSIIE